MASSGGDISVILKEIGGRGECYSQIFTKEATISDVEAKYKELARISGTGFHVLRGSGKILQKTIQLKDLGLETHETLKLLQKIR